VVRQMWCRWCSGCGVGAGCSPRGRRRINARQLRPVVGRVWPLAEGRQAFQAKRHGGLPGKAVLRVAAQR
jgi:hypothetical protein